MVTSIAIIGLLLLIWFRTDAWLEFTRLFHLNFLSAYKGYDLVQQQNPGLSYHQFLRIYHNCFFIRLITCPICLSVWFTIAFSLFMFGLGIIVTVLGGMGLGGLLEGLVTLVCNFPIIVLGGLTVYGAVNKLLK